MEASTGIEPVYTDLQSAASPLRQLAVRVVVAGYTMGRGRASGSGRSGGRSVIAQRGALWHHSIQQK